MTGNNFQLVIQKPRSSRANSALKQRQNGSAEQQELVVAGWWGNTEWHILKHSYLREV